MKRVIFRILYFFKEANKNIIRNKTWSLLVVFILSLSIISLGILFSFNEILRGTLDLIEKKAYINVYLDKQLDSSSTNAIIEKIKGLKGIDSVNYISPDEGLKNLQSSYPEYAEIFETIKYNPIPGLIKIKPSKLKNINEINSELISIKGISDIEYNKEAIDNIVLFVNLLRGIALFFIIFFSSIFVVILAITFFINISARSKEIEIFSLLGASYNFTRTPYLLSSLYYLTFSLTISLIFIPIFVVWIQSRAIKSLPFLEIQSTTNLPQLAFFLIVFAFIFWFIVSIVSFDIAYKENIIKKKKERWIEL